MHAIPDFTDINGLIQLSASESPDAKWAGGLSKVLTIIDTMRRPWIDLLYAGLVALAVPTLLINFC